MFKVNSAVEWAIKSQMESRALFFLELRRQMWTGGQRHAPATLPSRRGPVPILEEAGWDPGPAWTVGGGTQPHRDSISGPSSPQRVATPTELIRPI